MPTILDIESNEIIGLDAAKAVALFSKIIRTEARALGIPLSQVSVTSSINVTDGGVDARIDAPGITPIGAVKPGLTVYQIKTGGFSPQQKSTAEGELFTKERPADVYSKDHLKPQVRSRLDEGAAYVVVCFGSTLTDQKESEAVAHFTDALKKCGYPDPQVQVWDSDKIKSFISPFPALVFDVKNFSDPNIRTHDLWSRDALMGRTFVSDGDRQSVVDGIQSRLRTPESEHIMVLGEPGIGKTKLVLEATKTDDLGPSVVYTDNAEALLNSPLMAMLQNDEGQYFTILVVDECNKTEAPYIWSRLQASRTNIKLVTISNEIQEPQGTPNFEIPPLDENETKKVFETHGVPEPDAERWVPYCGGSPRVAHVIAENLSAGKENILTPPDSMESVWDRFVNGPDDPNSPETKLRRLVLEHVAVFRKVGGPKILSEFNALLAFIQKTDGAVTGPKLASILAELRRRRILQGENTHYITPKALHIKLWQDWWEKYGASFQLEAFLAELPDNLKTWFAEMFKYASDSGMAAQKVEELLGPSGPFQDSDFLSTKLGSGFFLALTEANPKAALTCLEKIIGGWNEDDFIAHNDTRQNLVWALERIAVWRDLFRGAAELLLKLAEHETEKVYSNNSTGTFAELFTLGHGRVAPTEAPPSERIPILASALVSEKKAVRVLGLRACEKALETNYTRALGAETQGLKRQPKLWMPKTYGEIFDAYRAIWNLVSRAAKDWDGEERAEAIRVLLNRSISLASMPNVADMVFSTLRELAALGETEKQSVLTEVLRINKYADRRLAPEWAAKWSELEEELEGTDFHSRLRRYAGLHLWLDEPGDVESRLGELTKQAIEDPSLLTSEYHWLLSPDAKNGFQFGVFLGKADAGFQKLKEIIDAQIALGDRGSTYFLSGYLKTLFDEDKERWEKTLDSLAKDKKTAPWVPEVTWRSGISDQAAARITNLIEKKTVPIEVLRIFYYGGVVSKLSEKAIFGWLDLLQKDGSRSAATIALHIFHSYFIFQTTRPIPEELAFDLLTHKTLLTPKPTDRTDDMEDYNWFEIAKRFLEQYPGRAPALASLCFPAFAAGEGIFSSYGSKTKEVMAIVAKNDPETVWNLIIERLNQKKDTFHLMRWLQGDGFFEADTPHIYLFPRADLFKWIDEDPEERAVVATWFAPKDIFDVGDDRPLILDIIEKYGGEKAVRNNAHANVFSEGWSGPASLHYSAKLSRINDLRKREKNKNVLKFLDEWEATLRERIEKAKMDEERRDW